MGTNDREETASNVLGTPLQSCCTDPVTGYYRNGKCHTGPGDYGLHVICVEMTDSFLEFGRDRGNDLISPNPQYQFPGLKEGDRWCLCLNRWLEALKVGCAPRIYIKSTHISALEFVDLDVLKKYAIDWEDQES